MTDSSPREISMLGASAEMTLCNSGLYAARHPSSRIFGSVPIAFASAGIRAIGIGVLPLLIMEMMFGFGNPASAAIWMLDLPESRIERLT